jgi:chromate transporter
VFGSGLAIVSFLYGGVARRQTLDFTSVLIVLATVITLLRFKKFQEPYIILAAPIIGLIIKLQIFVARV